MARATAKSPYRSSSHKLSRSAYPEQDNWDSPASNTPRGSGYKTASKAVVTETEPAALGVST